MLLDKGADPNVVCRDSDGKTCGILYEALKTDNVELIGRLLNYGIVPYSTMLSDACERTYINLIKQILKCKTEKQCENLNKRTRNTKEDTFIDAVVDNDVDKTCMLLSQGSVPNIDLLFVAVGLSYHSMSKALLTSHHKFDMSVQCNHDTVVPHSILRYVVWNEWVDVLELLLELGADSNSIHQDVSGLKYTLLQYAVECDNDNYSLVETLIKYGANPNTEFLDGNTALYHAICSDLPGIAEALLRHGADPDLQGEHMSSKLTVLEVAVCKCSLPLVSLLLKFHANPNTFGSSRDRFNNTYKYFPLWYAVNNN